MQINRCPKCGREPSVIRIKSIDGYGVEIECYDCGLNSGRCEAPEKAVTKWNGLTNNISSRGE